VKYQEGRAGEKERGLRGTRERQVVKYQEGRAGEKERGLRGTKAGSVERFRISLKYHAPQRVPPDASQARLRYLSDASDILAMPQIS
jgi:hypothetical protein